jgi:DNA (cytosine-5)-methyltransferase 1
MPFVRPSFLEFFAGGGMAHVGLSGRFDCAFANDLDPMKCAAYRANFPDARIEQGDVWNLVPASLPTADLAWASFPCQDLSLAGSRRGLNAPRSGAFWGFWNVMEKLGPARQRRSSSKTSPASSRPTMVVTSRSLSPSSPTQASASGQC